MYDKGMVILFEQKATIPNAKARRAARRKPLHLPPQDKAIPFEAAPTPQPVLTPEVKPEPKPEPKPKSKWNTVSVIYGDAHACSAVVLENFSYLWGSPMENYIYTIAKTNRHVPHYSLREGPRNTKFFGGRCNNFFFVSNYPGAGEQLADCIEQHGFGTVYRTEPRINPNHSGSDMSRAYMWCPDWAAILKFFDLPEVP